MSDVVLADVRAALGVDGVVLLDVRSPAEHAGAVVAPCDPRAGRIPGSIGLPLDELLGLAPAEIAERVGAPGSVRVIAYCHSGQRSALAATALRALGFDVANYVGSWHEWSRDPTLPIETG